MCQRTKGPILDKIRQDQPFLSNEISAQPQLMSLPRPNLWAIACLWRPLHQKHAQQNQPAASDLQRQQVLTQNQNRQ